MANFNKVVLLGNLTRDPQVRYVSSGSAVCEIGLAINRYWFDKATNTRKEETTFVDVTLWGRDAEVAGEYLAKGRPVLIEGRLQLDTWDDKATGQKRSKLRVVGEHMQLLSGRDGGGGEGGGSQGGGSQGGAARGGARGRGAPAAADQDSGPPPRDSYDSGPSDDEGGGDIPF